MGYKIISTILFFTLILSSFYAVTITDLNTQITNSSVQVQTLTAQISSMNQTLLALQTNLETFEAKAITNDDMPAIFADVDKHARSAEQQIVTYILVIVLFAFAVMAYGKAQKWW